jgi:hypothetical protein
MKTCPIHYECRRRSMSRRKFLVTGCAGAAGLVMSRSLIPMSQKKNGKPRIRTIYSLYAPQQDRPDWPNVGFDFRPVMEKINTELSKRCPEFEFLPVLADTPEAAEKILAEDASSKIDGYLVYQMNCWNRIVQTMAESGKPVLYADFQYGGSGGFLVYTARFLRNKTPNVGFVASSRMDDLVAAVGCFAAVQKSGNASDFAAATARIRRERTPDPSDLSVKPDRHKMLKPEECLQKMRESKILAVGGAWPGISKEIKEEMGIEVINVPFEEVNSAWEKADPDQTRSVADRWEKTAETITGVNRETLETSAAMYLGQKAVLEKHGANAITINCLGGFYGGHIHAYPCLGFFELNNEGLVGACECDIRSTATMVTITAMTNGRPGFISDPVIDTASRQIIYAHCVASNRVFGPQGEGNPFQILTHSEDRQGASVRSLMPLDYMTTTVEVSPEKRIFLLHRGKAVANVENDRACRTKLAVEPVGDIEKLFREWDEWGWHRVTFYGDLKEPVYTLADAMGWRVLEEA